MLVCVLREVVFVRKSEKMYEKALPSVCTHLCFFKGDFLYEEKSRSLHCALFIIHDVFLHFSKGREREREIDICREDNRY